MQCVVLTPGGDYETPGVHHASGRRGGCVAARGEGAAVADVDGVYAKLSAAGVKFDGSPQDESWGARMVGLKDPDGNNLYLLQKL